MYQSGGTPTIKPNPNFNANHSAEMLRKAMKGFGCDKNKVVQALCVCNNWQRQEVIKQFKVMYGKDLISELKSELSGDFEDLIMALMETPARYDAQQLRKAMAGIGTKESVLIEIMTTRSNAQVQELKNTYNQLYGKDLEDDLVGETSGHFKRLLVSLCAAGRDESWNVDPLRANQDARALYRAGEQRLGTDESTFNAILASQNFHQLRMVFDEYQKVSNHTIEHAIQAEFSSDIRDGLLAIVKSIRNRAAYFAELIYNSMVGLGTRDTDLIRLIVTRSEIDLADIRNQYQAQYRASLEKAIAGDCSGAYKEGLISLVKAANYIQIADECHKIFHVKLRRSRLLRRQKLVTVAFAGPASDEFLNEWQRKLARIRTVKYAREYLGSRAKEVGAKFFLVRKKKEQLEAWMITGALRESGVVKCEANTVYVLGGANQDTIKTIVETGQIPGQTKGSENTLALRDRMFLGMKYSVSVHPPTGDYCRFTTISLTAKTEIVRKLQNEPDLLKSLEKDFIPQRPEAKKKGSVAYEPRVEQFVNITTEEEVTRELTELA